MNKRKNITLSAPEELIEEARLKARAQGKSLNALFRSWLQRFVGRSSVNYEELMARLSHVESGRGFSRDELNER